MSGSQAVALLDPIPRHLTSRHSSIFNKIIKRCKQSLSTVFDDFAMKLATLAWPIYRGTRLKICRIMCPLTYVCNGGRKSLSEIARFVSRSYNYFKSIYLRAPLYVAINATLLLAVFESPAVEPLAAPYWVRELRLYSCRCILWTWPLRKGFCFRNPKWSVLSKTTNNDEV